MDGEREVTVRSDSRPALAGIRVLDCSQMLAGPLCTMRLGDLGADVVKVEPRDGEWNRRNALANVRQGGETMNILATARNKRSITLDLKQPEGLRVFLQLAEKSDVFVANFRVGTAERLGIGYEQLHAVNRGLIYCSISGFGEEGPYAGRPGQDLVIQGLSGSMWAVGADDDPPFANGLWAADVMTGYLATIGILAALHSRTETGVGQRVDVNMLAAVMDCQVQEITTYLNSGVVPKRTSYRAPHPWIPAPYNVYRTSDGGYVTIGYAPLPVLGELFDDDRLRVLTDWGDGFDQKDEANAIVASHVEQRTTEEMHALIADNDLWGGPVYDYEDLAKDPHVVATGMVETMEHPVAGSVRVPAIPISMSATPPSIRLVPPTLGQHTDEILSGLLGQSQEQIEQLRAAGVI